jgi:hypothetical protein
MLLRASVQILTCRISRESSEVHRNDSFLRGMKTSPGRIPFRSKTDPKEDDNGRLAIGTALKAEKSKTSAGS